MRYVATYKKIDGMNMMNGREIFASLNFTDMLGISLKFKDYSARGFDSLHELNPLWEREQQEYSKFIVYVKELLKFLHMAFIRDNNAEITLYPDKSLVLKIKKVDPNGDIICKFPGTCIVDCYPSNSEETHLLSKREIQEMVQLLNSLNLIDMIQ